MQLCLVEQLLACLAPLHYLHRMTVTRNPLCIAGARSSSSRRWSFVGSSTVKHAMREQACQDKELDEVLETLLEKLHASDRA